ncbi:cysteine hydrolase [Altererythrobacter sp. CC-YST694]|uniref:cysteine hydrolase family protein n=1 Tax=Altererythrobacter sp. CC-YST694 TaxID=2755038 RepID=UPI001D0254EC|nr:isochorismatase family cysteine hydrolase [Altererythrobacter sp. CC-YST694]MCB5424490.1 cysteine hydrolase [Altererythrobacter sp. CC-YST694]
MPHDVDHSAILDRLAATRGGVRNSFTDLDPTRIAHLIIDMQNGFMEEGAPVEVPMARDVVDNINRISAALRKAGGHNIFVRFTTPPEGSPSWSNFHFRMGPGAQAHREAFTPGAHYWQLWPELDIAEDELVIEKQRFSAFTPGTCDLNATLRERGIDTVLISGTLTNCCCESTARDAMQHNYRVLVAADANAALSDEEHAATLHNMAFVFADLYSTREIEGLFAVD